MNPFQNRYVVTLPGDADLAAALQDSVLAAVQDGIDNGVPSFDVPCPGATDGALVLLMRSTGACGMAVSRGTPIGGVPQLHYGAGGPLPDPSVAGGDPASDQALAEAFAPAIAAAVDSLLSTSALAKQVPLPGATGGAIMILLAGVGGTDTDAYGLRGAGWRAGRGINKPGVGPQIQISK